MNNESTWIGTQVGFNLRISSFTEDSYRYHFNGQETEDEVYGAGNMTTAEYWQYDTRLGRRWNIDPVETAYRSNYATFANNPLEFADPKGDVIHANFRTWVHLILQATTDKELRTKLWHQQTDKRTRTTTTTIGDKTYEHTSVVKQHYHYKFSKKENQSLTDAVDANDQERMQNEIDDVGQDQNAYSQKFGNRSETIRVGPRANIDPEKEDGNGPVTLKSKGKYDDVTIDVFLLVNNGNQDPVRFDIYIGNDVVGSYIVQPTGEMGTDTIVRDSFTATSDKMGKVKLKMTNVNNPHNGPGDTSYTKVKVTRNEK